MGNATSGCCDKRDDDFQRNPQKMNMQTPWDKGAQAPAKQLPPDWEEIYSKSTGKFYFYNRSAACFPTPLPSPARAVRHIASGDMGISVLLVARITGESRWEHPD